MSIFDTGAFIPVNNYPFPSGERGRSAFLPSSPIPLPFVAAPRMGGGDRRPGEGTQLSQKRYQ